MNVTHAMNLEVSYPVISGQTINTDTKLPAFVTYLFNSGMALGYFAVLVSLVIAGVMYFLSPVNAGMLSEAKERVSGAISGLLILTLTYLIVTTINPQLNIFNSAELPQTPPAPTPAKAPGVYFYNQSDCSGNRVQSNTSSIQDLGDLRNKVNSVGIIQGGDGYIPILYDNVNFWGECQYLDPNKTCQKVSPFTASASIHQFDPSPNGDGVYFYRKSCFSHNNTGDIKELINYCNNNSGGFYKISNSSMSGGAYVAKLENLKFQNVPTEEQDCAKYDSTGQCSNTGRRLPSLSGENMSSLIINGNYLVLFVYAGLGNNPSGPWTSCQEFPTGDDTNKIGPQQIKWQRIRNSSNAVPNYVVIVPVKKN